MAQTVFTPSLEGMEHVKAENKVILTKPFLDVCKQILPVLGNSSASLSAAYKLGVLDGCKQICVPLCLFGMEYAGHISTYFGSFI